MARWTGVGSAHGLLRRSRPITSGRSPTERWPQELRRSHNPGQIRGSVRRYVELTRRALLARAGLATGALALGKAERGEAKPDLTDWAAVRAQFALARNRIHLTSFLLAAHPRPVRDAIDRHRRGLDANPVDYLHENEGRLTAEARAAAGRFLAVPSSEIALTDSTTMGLGLLYTRLGCARRTRSSRPSTTSTPRTRRSGSPARACAA